jgi:hypothetical protein
VDQINNGHNNNNMSVDADEDEFYRPMSSDDDVGYETRVARLSDVSALESLPKPFRHEKRFKTLSSALANFSIQYNFNSITLALVFVTQHRPGGQPLYDVSSNETSLLKSLVFVGAVLGQLFMGYLGDCWGRNNAMLFTNFLVVFGALASALATGADNADDAQTFVNAVGVCRLLIGIGIGGNYPLAATMSREALPTDDAASGGSSAAAAAAAAAAVVVGTDTDNVLESAAANKAATKVASSFFWQWPGMAGPYVVGLVLSLAFYPDGDEVWGQSNRTQTAVAFRLVLGLGAIPSMVVIGLLLALRCADHRYRSQQPALWTQAKRSPAESPTANNAGEEPPGRYDPRAARLRSHLDYQSNASVDDVGGKTAAKAKPLSQMKQLCTLMLSRPDFFLYLVATGGCWFFYDIV